MSTLELSKLVIHYERSNKVEGKSPFTIHGYTYVLSKCIYYLEKQGVPPLLSAMALDVVKLFILEEQGRGLSPCSVQDEVRGLKAFASWLAREGYLAENVLARLKLAKAPQKPIEILTAAEIDRLLKHQDPLTELGARSLAMLVTFLESGIRVTELRNIELEDAHVEEGYIKIIGKGAKERVVPIGAHAQKMLWRYIIHFRPKPSPGYNRLFLTIEGEPRFRKSGAFAFFTLRRRRIMAP